MIPPIGGDTLFSDNYRAYESLSPAFRDMINGLKATHSAAFAYSPKGVLAKQEKSKTRTMKILYSEEADKIQLHPLVRTHPGSGRKAIYVNPVYTTGIGGMSKEESFVILSFLFQILAKEEFIYRHHWQENMLLMWDNRCCNHLEEGGYDGHRRLMHRTTVLGEEPKHN